MFYVHPNLKIRDCRFHWRKGETREQKDIVREQWVTSERAQNSNGTGTVILIKMWIILLSACQLPPKQAEHELRKPVPSFQILLKGSKDQCYQNYLDTFQQERFPHFLHPRKCQWNKLQSKKPGFCFEVFFFLFFLEHPNVIFSPEGFSSNWFYEF